MAAGSGRSTTARRLLTTLLFGLMVVTSAASPLPEPSTSWGELNAAALKAYQEGQYDEGTGLAEQALALARQVFGPRHPDTLTSMNDLALLYASQGRYGEAEPLLTEALQLGRGVLGSRHPDTLTAMNNL